MEGLADLQSCWLDCCLVSAGGKGRFRRIPFRYGWPAEMDLMARIAGMSLKYRWAGWGRSAFTAQSTTHVPVWEKR
jgi:hypothetical protein